jgi:hypothetical protein
LYGFVLFKSCKATEAGYIVFSLFVGSISSLILLILAPGVPGRSLIPFYFISFVPIIFSFASVSSSRIRGVVAVIVCTILFFAVKDTQRVYKGYESNYETNVINHQKLSSFSFDLKNKVSTSTNIVLYKLPMPTYAETMPYQRPVIEKWMKKYYELPQEVDFIWRDLNL